MNRASRRRAWLRVAQALASAAVLWVLLRDVDLAALGDLWGRVAMGWLLLAVAVKAAALVLHEVRLWLALPPPRPRLCRVLVIGFTANALNLFLPARGGDVVAIALLNRECGVPADAATVGVGVVAFLEAVIFGVFLLGVLSVGAAHWDQVIGAAARGQALRWLALLVAGAVALWVLAVVVGGAIGRESTQGERFGLVRRTLGLLGVLFADPGYLVRNTAVAVVQVVGHVLAFTALLPAVGIDVPMPWLAAAGVLAVASVASVVLPPSWMAGPAAASVAVLGVFGVGTATALAYAAAWWVVTHVPGVALGLPAIWIRRL